MKGNNSLFAYNRTQNDGVDKATPKPPQKSSKIKFKLDLQFFAAKDVSDKGKKLQNSVANQKLKNTIGEMYRRSAKVGDGSLAAATREQVKTGKLVGGKDHIKKAEERIRNMENILRKETLNSKDRKTALKLINQLKKALKGEK